MVFGFIPVYLWLTIAIIGMIFLILGGIIVRKENDEFNHPGLFIFIGVIAIILIPINYLLINPIVPAIVFNMSLRNIIGSLTSLVIWGIFLIFLGLKNKEQEGKWLEWAGIIQCISSIVAIIMWAAILFNCASISNETEAAYCMSKMFDNGFKYIQYLYIALLVVSSLFFLIFCKIFNQKFLMISAIIGFCLNLMILIDIAYPTTFNF